jgi:hypothetical protein
MNFQRSAELNELKKQALTYYSTNPEITKNVEDSLNHLFYDSPEDVYGYLAEFFGRLSRPATISRIYASNSIFYDCKCQSTFHLELYFNIKNEEKKIVDIIAPCFYINDILLNDSSKIQIIQDDDHHRNDNLIKIIDFINGEVNIILENYNPITDQKELDSKLVKIYERKQSEHLSMNSSISNESTTQSATQNHLPTTEDENDSSKKAKKSGTAATKDTTKQQQGGRNKSAGQNQNERIELKKCFDSNFEANYTLSIISKIILLSASKLTNRQPFEQILQLVSNVNISILFKYQNTILVSILINNRNHLPFQYQHQSFQFFKMVKGLMVNNC